MRCRMLPLKPILILLLSTFASSLPLESRTITRSARTRDANVVEFAIGGKLHGKCSYTDRIGRDISLIYEEENGVIKARSLNTMVVDPAAAVRECRSVAEKVPNVEKNLEGRSGLAGSVGESPIELKARFDRLSKINQENREYVSHLEPRLITWLGSLTNGFNFGSSSSNNNNFGLSWGDSTGYNPLPGINLFAPNNNNHLTTTYGNTNPFDFLGGSNTNTGPWGIMNSISGNNGLFGLGGLNWPFGLLG